MEIKIPNLKAPSWNQLYSGKHWTARKKLADEIHELVRVYSLGKRIFHKKVDIHIIARYKGKHRRDSDNLCAKVFIDGLVGLVIEDDSTQYVRRVTTEIQTGLLDEVVIKIELVQ